MGHNSEIDYDHGSFARWLAKQSRQPTIEKIAERLASLAIMIRSLPKRSKKRIAYQAILDELTKKQLKLEIAHFEQREMESDEDGRGVTKI